MQKRNKKKKKERKRKSSMPFCEKWNQVGPCMLATKVGWLWFYFFIKEIEGEKKWNSAKGNKKTAIWENECQTKNG